MKMLLGPTALPTSGLGTCFKCHSNGHLLRVDGWAVPPVRGLVHDSLLHMQAYVGVGGSDSYFCGDTEHSIVLQVTPGPLLMFVAQPATCPDAWSCLSDAAGGATSSHFFAAGVQQPCRSLARGSSWVTGHTLKGTIFSLAQLAELLEETGLPPCTGGDVWHPLAACRGCWERCNVCCNRP
jgi:hypothetical protein